MIFVNLPFFFPLINSRCSIASFDFETESHDGMTITSGSQQSIEGTAEQKHVP